MRIPRLPKAEVPHGSDIAEVIAVTRALQRIPEGSYVAIYMDCKGVVDWLNKGVIETRSKAGLVTLSREFEVVMARAGLMAETTFTHLTSGHNPGLKRVHNLSRAASLPQAG